MEEVSNLYIISDFTYTSLCKRLHKAVTRKDNIGAELPNLLMTILARSGVSESE